MVSMPLLVLQFAMYNDIFTPRVNRLRLGNVVITPKYHTVGSLVACARIVSAGSVGLDGRQPQPFRFLLQHFAVADAGNFPA